ncbi:MAG: PEGA domain-containing protein [Candidatus Woesearchaeota archaeon]
MQDKNNLFLLSIVAIIAIIGIVLMTMTSSSKSSSIISSEDLAGDATRVITSQSADSTPSEKTPTESVKDSNDPGAITAPSCLDTDNGKNYFVKGTTYVIQGSTNSSKTDYCKNNLTLNEYYCKSVDISGITYNCPYGCIGGACVEENNSNISVLLSLGQSSQISYHGSNYILKFINYEPPTISNYGSPIAHITINNVPYTLREYEYKEAGGLRMYADSIQLSIYGNGSIEELYLEIPYDSCNQYNNYCQGSSCGDGVLNANEQCDSHSPELYCSMIGFNSGQFSCGNDCTVQNNCYNYTPICGNNYKEASEQCDEDDLGYFYNSDILMTKGQTSVYYLNGHEYRIDYLGGNFDYKTILIRVDNSTRTIGPHQNRLVGGLIISFDIEDFYDIDHVMIKVKYQPLTCSDIGFDDGELSCYENCVYDTTYCETYNNSCYDTDGLNYYDEGYISGVYNGDTFFYDDDCVNSQIVIEYICDGTNPGNVTYNCPYGCDDSACVNQTQLGNLYVLSNPSTANVYIDNIYRGTTPVNVINLSVGNHTVKLTKSGYYDYTTLKYVYVGQTYVNVTLVANQTNSTLKPDLIVEDIILKDLYNLTLPNNVSRLTVFKVLPKIKNIGNISVNASGFYNNLRVDSTSYNTLKCFEGSYMILPGQSFTCNPVSYLVNMSIGVHMLNVTTDYMQNIVEINENNNARLEYMIINP